MSEDVADDDTKTLWFVNSLGIAEGSWLISFPNSFKGFESSMLELK